MKYFLQIFLFGLIVSSCTNNNPISELEEKETEDYYNKYGIILIGQVITKKCIDDRYCLFELKINSCNTKKHDLRNMSNEYYLTINDTTALIVDGYAGSINEGDLIIINYKERKRVIIRDHKHIQTFELPENLSALRATQVKFSF